MKRKNHELDQHSPENTSKRLKVEDPQPSVVHSPVNPVESPQLSSSTNPVQSPANPVESPQPSVVQSPANPVESSANPVETPKPVVHSPANSESSHWSQESYIEAQCIREGGASYRSHWLRAAGYELNEDGSIKKDIDGRPIHHSGESDDDDGDNNNPNGGSAVGNNGGESSPSNSPESPNITNRISYDFILDLLTTIIRAVFGDDDDHYL